MAASAPTVDIGVPAGPALMMLMDLNLSVRDKTPLETALKQKRRWSQLELIITSLIKRRRFIVEENGGFGMTTREAAIVQEYLTYCTEPAASLLWRELGLDNVIVIKDEHLATAAVQNATPPDNPGMSGASSSAGCAPRLPFPPLQPGFPLCPQEWRASPATGECSARPKRSCSSERT